MSNDKHPVPTTECEWRVRWVRLQQIAAGDIDVPGTRYPTTDGQRAAARKREVEVLALEAGLPPPPWVRPAARRRAEPIDETPWRAERERAIRAQWNRLGRHGLALARDGTIRCAKCKKVVHARERGRPSAMGAPPSALAVLHAEETGCR